MKLIPIPETDLEVSAIAYGCMNLGGTWDDSVVSRTFRKRASRALATALEGGINLFDHADIYCRGKSEQVFGEILAASPGLRSRIVIQTKCGIRFEDHPRAGDPPRYDLSCDHILSCVEASLRRLQTDYLDILLLHRPDPLARPAEIGAAFARLHEQGKVRYFGVSNHDGIQVERLQAAIDHKLVVNQVQLSLLHSDLIWSGLVFNEGGQSRPMESIDELTRHNLLLQAWSPLAQGKILGREGRPENPFSAVARLIARIARLRGLPREAVALAWLLRHPGPIQPIVGTTSARRLRACLRAPEVDLTREEWYALLQNARQQELP